MSRKLTQLPPTASPGALARHFTVLFLGGAVLALVVALMPAQSTNLRGLLVGCSVVAVVVAAGVRRTGFMNRMAVHAVLILASLFTTAAALLATDGVVRVAFTCCYAVLVVVSVASCSWCGAAGHTVLALTSILLLASVTHDVDGTAWVLAGHILVMVWLFSGRILRAAFRAEVDALTGLANRRGAERHLEAVVAAHAAGEVLAVAVLDIDHFKAVNDQQGHAAGDEQLCRVADALRTGLAERGSGTQTFLARWGGDEFVVTAPLDAARLAALLDRTRAHCQDGPTWSIGITQAGLGDTPADLFERADRALYAVKHDGRAATRIATRQAEDDEAVLLVDLVDAVASGALEVAYQPIVTPTDGEVVGVEALARWTHPTRGPISPAVFIPLAERAGVIGELGRLVTRKAFVDVVSLRTRSGGPLLLTINASGPELTQPAYAATLLRAVSASGLDATSLIVEVTESSLDAASSSTRHTLRRLRQAGVRVAIDDFGTGYSAFSQLDTIPADYLKLDHLFTSQTTSSPRRLAMMRAVVDLGAALGIEVIAEGVETAEQARVVAEQGCALAQGYLYAKPLSVQRLSAILEPAQDQHADLSVLVG